MMKKKNIKEYFNQEIERLRETTPVAPSLMIIDATKGDAANQIYIKNKVKDFEAMGWRASVAKCSTSEELEDTLAASSRDFTNVIVQMPVAEGIDFSYDMIPAYMDCDGLNPVSIVMPATVRGIIDYLDACGFEYAGNSAVIVGRSDIVGKPMARALLERNMTVSVCHSKTPARTRKRLMDHADLVIVAAGHPHLVHRVDCPTAIVIDVGINRVDGKLVGDFEEDERYILNNAWSTPVPGGVGLLTRLGLMKNCVTLTHLQSAEDDGQITMEEYLKERDDTL